MTNHKKKIVIGTLVIAALSLIYLLRLEAIGWYFWHNSQSISEKHALNLKGYRVEIDGLKIKGIKNASELTYDSNTNTLFTVLNKENKIVELNLTGKVLRVVDVEGVNDMEGITYIDNNRFVIADEHDSRLILVDLAPNVTELNVKDSPKIRLGINESSNKNLEGVSWDDRQQKLLVVKERDPKYVISVKGFVNASKSGELDLEIESLHKYDHMLAWAMRDLSAVKYLSKSGHTLLLSDESKLVKEFDENAKPLGAMALWAGFHGLRNNIPQAEGITIDSNDNIYIISEPNLFYVFKPKIN
jgi:uncharacterized protein YjiK